MTGLKRLLYGLAPALALAAVIIHPMSWRW
jgi:hypothetical protein